MSLEPRKLIHWADFTADRIIRQKGDKEEYVLASGITPSGVVHFGNFREVITVDLVARALRDRGKKVRFIFSWDDFDTFRKIPKNMPRQKELEDYLFMPIVDTPDPYGQEESYARHHQVNFENQLREVGIEAEYLYQAQKYRLGEYREAIVKTLQARAEIMKILNTHRSQPLAENWWPVSVYCENCNRDKMKDIHYGGDLNLNYTCELCAHEGCEELATSKRIKLPWRVDWPMRWAYEKVDFEPGGKDHSSQGGSYTTAQEIVRQVYQSEPPIYLQYDFVSIKGGGGKMSSSQGDVITVSDVLKIYEPEIVRWIFASYKTNVDFAVSFDLDVLKVYEDFDKQERLAFGVEQGNEKKVNMAKRVYELAQIGAMPTEMPFQPSFRHLANILQIHGGDLEKARHAYEGKLKNPRDERRFRERAQCALHWLDLYAPEEFKFSVNEQLAKASFREEEKKFLQALKSFITRDWEALASDKDLHEKLYELIHAEGIEPAAAFKMLYQILISKDKGPKLAGFMRTIGRDKVLTLISQCV